MPRQLQHALNVPGSADDAARMDFVSGLRAFVLNDLAADLKCRYTEVIEPRLQRQGGAPEDGAGVHRVLKQDTTFRYYSSIRSWRPGRM